MIHESRIALSSATGDPVVQTSSGQAAYPGANRRRRVANWIRVALVLLTLILYGRGLAHSRGSYGDAFHHLINGVFLYDVFQQPTEFLRDPWAFGGKYYLHFPAVSLGYYMPGFPLIESLLMLVLGVSPATGQLAVLLCAIAMALFTYEWFRLRFGHWWAAGGTVVLVSMPQLVYWGRDIMLEIPMMAFVIGAMWLFEKLCRQEQPRWSTAISWGIVTAAAVLIKQHALLLLAIYFFSMLAVRRWGHLRFPAIWIGILIGSAAAAGVVAVTFALGGDAVGHSIGFTKQHALDRFVPEQWTFYLGILPTRIGSITLALAAVGLISAFQSRDRYVWPYVIWIVCFYIMHSYFKAQSARYACLWIPPFVMLSVIGLRFFSDGFERPSAKGYRHLKWVGASALAAYAALILAHTIHLKPTPVPSAYQRSADDLCERLGGYTCLTFFPDRPGRIAVCFRMAVEEKSQQTGSSIYSFGRILRAKQVFRDGRERWGEADALSKALKDWNVKCLSLIHI